MNILYTYKADCREKLVITESCSGSLLGVVGLPNHIVYSLRKVALHHQSVLIEAPPLQPLHLLPVRSTL